MPLLTLLPFQSHSAKDRAVRFRCCQLVNKLLTNLGEEAQIDDELYDRLYECMLERLKDKCPVVRYHAALAMARLQDPTDDNCPVIKGKQQFFYWTYLGESEFQKIIQMIKSKKLIL